MRAGTVFFLLLWLAAGALFVDCSGPMIPSGDSSIEKLRTYVESAKKAVELAEIAIQVPCSQIQLPTWCNPASEALAKARGALELLEKILGSWGVADPDDAIAAKSYKAQAVVAQALFARHMQSFANILAAGGVTATLPAPEK
jgi:hypothetical protein